MAAALTSPPATVAFDRLALAHFRRLCGLTRDQLADRAGCSAEMVRSLEYGRTGASIRLLPRLAAALGVGVGDLFRAGGDVT